MQRRSFIALMASCCCCEAFEEGMPITAAKFEEAQRKAEDFARPHDCIFDGAMLKNQHDKPVTCSDLIGKSVALYFAGEWCPLCRRFTPALQNFYQEHGESVEIVFISSDESEHEAELHYKHQLQMAAKHDGRLAGWLALAHGDPLSETLKRKHRVWSGREVETFGYGRRSGVPCVIVIDRAGEEQTFIQGERFGAAALREWEPGSTTAWRLKEEV